ncbi:histidine biosynthesis bifunctional protein HisIE [Blochmannia endosymbiont of Polyrhachis (Hedomyrma) turneri]|nr:histidine biosynthesis bifunctional protein HisIE [Blochmannia endosymbiont of Polyrhachis (Hedomyrma) turneri]
MHNLTPTIIQHAISGEVLMLGYMNDESIKITKNSGYVTFFSRSKKRLWTKGETSGNRLQFIRAYEDCDKDTLLMLVLPNGPTCHKNNSTCFYPAMTDWGFLYKLEEIVKNRKCSYLKNSYTKKLYASGSKRIAQKVGEEGIETALAAVTQNKKELINEAADLIYHLLVLLETQSLNLTNIIKCLHDRHNKIIT